MEKKILAMTMAICIALTIGFVYQGFRIVELEQELLFCMNCKDVFNLNMRLKSCTCGRSRGRYQDDLNASFKGSAIPLGFANKSFIAAIQNQPKEGPGRGFEAFVVESNCPTFKKLSDD